MWGASRPRRERTARRRDAATWRSPGRDQGAIYGCLPDASGHRRREAEAMLSSPASRLAAYASALVLLGGAAAAVGSATNPTPPFQDCLAVAAAHAGLQADDGMGGGSGEPMIPA